MIKTLRVDNSKRIHQHRIIYNPIYNVYVIKYGNEDNIIRNAVSLGKIDVLNIYHDEHKQFGDVLEHWTRYMKGLDIGIGELIKILNPLLCNCNIVAPQREQLEFFNQCGMKAMRTPIPFIP